MGAEICGHVFVDGLLYVLRGTEQDGENWPVARLEPKEDDAARRRHGAGSVRAARLTFDGLHFWTNHRAANETVCFDLPTR